MGPLIAVTKRANSCYLAYEPMTDDAMSTPTLINLPPPPSEPVTPSDRGPGTPNSGTTSLSALSTTAIKDGHHGQTYPHSRHAHQSSTTSASSVTVLDAERADRISRLAGLEPIATVRAGGNASHSPGYFDSYAHLLKERSTVGSASATGSVGACTTWASGSDAFDPDKLSEDQDSVSSVGGFSDEGNASLVGFGEGASSTISGPVSSAMGLAGARSGSSGGRPSSSSLGSPSASRTSVQPPTSVGSPMSGVSHSQSDRANPSLLRGDSNTPEPLTDVRMVNGITYDPDIVDTTVRTPRLVSQEGRAMDDVLDQSGRVARDDDFP